MCYVRTLLRDNHPRNRPLLGRCSSRIPQRSSTGEPVIINLCWSSATGEKASKGSDIKLFERANQENFVWLHHHGRHCTDSSFRRVVLQLQLCPEPMIIFSLILECRRKRRDPSIKNSPSSILIYRWGNSAQRSQGCLKMGKVHRKQNTYHLQT